MSEVWKLRNQTTELEVVQAEWLRAQKSLALNLTGPIVTLDVSNHVINTWAGVIAAQLAADQLSTPLVIAYRRLLANPLENNSDLFYELIKAITHLLANHG